MDSTTPVLPDYGGACISSVTSALAARHEQAPPWLPEPVLGARQIVLVVLDGLGWHQLKALSVLAPTVLSGSGGPITSVVPTTTATALTSITTGLVPAEHGVVGYRMAMPSPSAGGAGEVLNVLRWQLGARDARRTVPPPSVQTHLPFGGRPVTAVTRSEFAPTGFTAAHLRGVRLVGWRVPSTLVVEVRALLHAGEPFVYAYYDGLDKVAHEYGLGERFSQEMSFVDRLVGDLIEALPPGAALVLTSDHGQVDVPDPARVPAAEVLEATTLLSGEGRFRWLHAKPGAADDLAKAAEEAHGSEAWVRTREQMVDERWFGGAMTPEVARRLGDVALVAHAPIAFLDPADTGETRLLARHGSLTEAEMRVPLLAWRPT